MARRKRVERATEGGKQFAELFEGGELALWSIIAVWARAFIQKGVASARDRRIYRKRVRDLAEQMRAESIRTAQTLIENNFIASLEELEAGLNRIGMEMGKTEAARQEADAALESLIQELSDQFTSEIRYMLRDADDVYRRVIESARDLSGETSLESAVQDALNQFADEGVTGFLDRAGRRWGLWEYADMAMRTALNRASLQAEITGMIRAGIDLCYANPHTGACPHCVQWQGRILSLTGRTPGYPTLQQAMDDGLFHPNCAHILLVYIPGVSRLDAGVSGVLSPQQSAEIYRERQKQRYMERQIRKWKRRQAAAITPENERIAKAHVDLWQRRVREHIDGNAELPRRYDREGGRVLLSEEAKKLKPLKIGENGAIIKAESGQTGLRIDGRQIGKKAGKHMAEWGLDPSNPDDRKRFQEISRNIYENADEVRSVEWNFDSDGKRTVRVNAYILGEDVVLAEDTGVYITTMKGGTQNKRVQNGRRIQ